MDVSNYVGDILIVVDLGSVTGSLGSLNVQMQSATAATGAAAANETADPRNSGLLTVVALGAAVMPYGINYLANKFVGVATTFTGITACVAGVLVLGRKRIN